MPDYRSEELQQLYENLPKNLQKAIFSEKVAETLQGICQRSGVGNDKTIEEVARYTGHVLLGLLPPNELRETLEKEVGISPKKAQQVSREISSFVFLSVKKNLEALYGIKIAPQLSSSQEKQSHQDKYRELIE